MEPHLLFADDILLYAHYNDTTVQSIISILSYFSNISGQKVNSSKSKLFFAKSINPRIKERIITALNERSKNVSYSWRMLFCEKILVLLQNFYTNSFTLIL